MTASYSATIYVSHSTLKQGILKRTNIKEKKTMVMPKNESTSPFSASHCQLKKSGKKKQDRWFIWYANARLSLKTLIKKEKALQRQRILPQEDLNLPIFHRFPTGKSFILVLLSGRARVAMKCQQKSIYSCPEPSKVRASVPLCSLLIIGKLISPKDDTAPVTVEE